jgi:hypothetical protein
MADQVFDYTYATNNAAPPGNQQIRLNQTSAAAVTAVYVDDQNVSGATVRSQLLATTPGSQLTIVSGNNSAVFASYTVSAVTGQSGYVEFTVTYQTGSGTIQNGACTLELTAAATGTAREVISFVNFRPPPRYDNLPFTQVIISESVDGLAPWTQIDTLPLIPVDLDPSQPQLRSFTTEKGTAPDYWYQMVFADETGDVSQPTIPIQNTGASTVGQDLYGTTAELGRILKITRPTPAQLTAMDRVLAAASGEVNAEIDRTDALAGWQIQLATEVTLERAVEHWQQQEVPYGIWENAVGPVVVGRDTFDRHALKLAPLKQQWGMA